MAKISRKSHSTRSELSGDMAVPMETTQDGNLSGPQSTTAKPSPAVPNPFTIPDLSLRMVKIPKGTFLMGSPESEMDRCDDETQHEVELTQDFWIGVTPVTQGQWKALMGNNPSEFKLGDNYPVETVEWLQAKEFCLRLTKRESSAGRLPAGWEYTLPTEAQWEYACRAVTSKPFSFGDSLNGDRANCNGTYPYNALGGVYQKQTTPIGKYQSNAWGLWDVHGNVWEWCQDYYAAYNGKAKDPVGPQEGTYRVLRGGSWYNNAGSCRSARRNCASPKTSKNYIGFRLVLVPVK